MIRITSVATEPLAELHYMNARSGGGSEVSRLEVLRADLAGPLGDELDAIICCSDLQGMLRGELLGVAIAELLVELAEQRVLPPSARTGIILAGDLYSVPAANERGGYGDVSNVWEAFAARYPWVCGVAGNHDDMQYVVGLGKHVHVLDGQSVVVDGVRIGGVGRIIGNAKKPGRRDEDGQLERIEQVVAERCDIVVLHEGPNGDGRQHGNPTIRAVIEDVPLTVCGHCHWKRPLAENPRGQILNVDGRVVVLTAAPRE